MTTLTNRGRTAERDVARMLTRWAHPLYTFYRRDFGGDLVVETSGAPTWPFVISVKAGAGPSLPAMLAAIQLGRPWPWWRELERDRDPATDRVDPERQAQAWLIWKCRASWMLSVWTLGGLEVPPRLSILPLPGTAGWPRFTMLLGPTFPGRPTRLGFLASVPIGQVVAAIGDGWGQA